MGIRFITLVFAIAVNGFLAFTVYRNNPKSATNRIFASLSLVTVLWLIDIYISANPTYIENSLLWVRLSIFLAAPQITLFYLLANTLPYEKLQISRRKIILLTGLTLLVMIDALSPLAFTEVSIVKNEVQATPGPGMALFSIFAITFSVSAVYALIKKYRQSVGYVRDQYGFVLLGLISMLGLLTLTILIPVALFKNSQFVPLAPLYTVAFLGFTTYAIVRKRLFDVRVVVARSVAYLLTLGVILSVFALFIFGFSGNVLTSQDSVLIYRLILVLVTLAGVLVYPRLKRYFDHLTNSIFYRDAYDTQEFLDELNTALVTNIELEKLLSLSSKIIDRHLKPVYSFFAILPKGVREQHLIGSIKTDIQIEDLETIHRHLHPTGVKVILTSEVSPSHVKLLEILKKYAIGAIVPLRAHSETIGYLLLGEKKSGSVYSKIDIRLIEIFTEELSIATQNSLRFEEISRFNITLQQKIDRATKQLRDANSRLKDLDRTKDEFISMASHQLRTPLTTVKGYLSMVLEGDTGKITKSQKDLLQRSFDGADRMVYLIGDLLNVSRLQSGKFVIDNKPTDLSKLIDTEMKQLQESAANHQLKLTFHKPNNFPELLLDETKIMQVVMNFMDNAIYYTPKGGSVDVELKSDDKSITFTVTDNGLGVPKADQHHLFTKFYRAGNARKMRPDGTGLGLFMAKKVIVAQGGAIIFKSAEGKGSTFGFTFPLHAVQMKK